MLAYVVPGHLPGDERTVLHPPPVGGRRFISPAAEGGRGAGISAAVRPGGFGGAQHSGGAQPAPGGAHCEERLMRKERNPARPAVTRLCGIYYGIKQKER